MAIALDASAPATASNTGSGGSSVQTASFTPPAGSLLVAMATQGYSGSTTSATFNVTDSNSGTWTQSIFRAGTGGVGNQGVYTQLIATSAAMTVTLTTDTATQGHLLQVAVLTGTATTAWGGATTTSASTMDGSVTTTTVGSMVFGVAEWDAGSTLHTADGNSTVLANIADTSNACEYVAFRSTNTIVTPGAATYGVTGVSSSCGYAAVEIKPAAAATAAPLAPPPNNWTARMRASTW